LDLSAGIKGDIWRISSGKLKTAKTLINNVVGDNIPLIKVF